MMRRVLLLSCLSAASAFSFAPFAGLGLRSEHATVVARGPLGGPRAVAPGACPVAVFPGSQPARTR